MKQFLKDVLRVMSRETPGFHPEIYDEGRYDERATWLHILAEAEDSGLISNIAHIELLRLKRNHEK